MRVREARSRWHLASGVKPGMILAEVVQLNGAPVSFYGLDWDYGGGITDWHGGKVAAADERDHVMVRLGHRDDAGGFPVGEDTFRSDDARYPVQGKQLQVGEIGVAFPR